MVVTSIRSSFIVGIQEEKIDIEENRSTVLYYYGEISNSTLWKTCGITCCLMVSNHNTQWSRSYQSPLSSPTWSAPSSVNLNKRAEDQVILK